jgi:hypothetical protein
MFRIMNQGSASLGRMGQGSVETSGVFGGPSKLTRSASNRSSRFNPMSSITSGAKATTRLPDITNVISSIPGSENNSRCWKNIKNNLLTLSFVDSDAFRLSLGFQQDQNLRWDHTKTADNLQNTIDKIRNAKVLLEKGEKKKSIFGGKSKKKTKKRNKHKGGAYPQGYEMVTMGTPPGGMNTPPGGMGTPPGGMGTPPGGMDTPPGGMGNADTYNSSIGRISDMKNIIGSIPGSGKIPGDPTASMWRNIKNHIITLSACDPEDLKAWAGDYINNEELQIILNSISLKGIFGTEMGNNTNTQAQGIRIQQAQEWEQNQKREQGVSGGAGFGRSLKNMGQGFSRLDDMMKIIGIIPGTNNDCNTAPGVNGECPMWRNLKRNLCILSCIIGSNIFNQQHPVKSFYKLLLFKGLQIDKTLLISTYDKIVGIKPGIFDDDKSGSTWQGSPTEGEHGASWAGYYKKSKKRNKNKRLRSLKNKKSRKSQNKNRKNRKNKSRSRR